MKKIIALIMVTVLVVSLARPMKANASEVVVGGAVVLSVATVTYVSYLLKQQGLLDMDAGLIESYYTTLSEVYKIAFSPFLDFYKAHTEKPKLLISRSEYIALKSSSQAFVDKYNQVSSDTDRLCLNYGDDIIATICIDGVNYYLNPFYYELLKQMGVWNEIVQINAYNKALGIANQATLNSFLSVNDKSSQYVNVMTNALTNLAVLMRAQQKMVNVAISMAQYQPDPLIQWDKFPQELKDVILSWDNVNYYICHETYYNCWYVAFSGGELSLYYDTPSTAYRSGALYGLTISSGEVFYHINEEFITTTAWGEQVIKYAYGNIRYFDKKVEIPVTAEPYGFGFEKDLPTIDNSLFDDCIPKAVIDGTIIGALSVLPDTTSIDTNGIQKDTTTTEIDINSETTTQEMNNAIDQANSETDTLPDWYDIIGWLKLILGAIIDLASAILDPLLGILKEAFEWLFVPDQVVIDGIINRMELTLSEKTGVLTYPFAVLYKFSNRVLSLETEDCVLNFPKIQFKDYVLYEGSSINMTELTESDGIKDIYGYYKIGSNAILIGLVIMLARKKYYEMMGGNEIAD